jgi:hypothetical protein
MFAKIKGQQLDVCKKNSNGSAYSMADATVAAGASAQPLDAERAAESAKPSPILVTYPVTETDDERKARIKSGKPAVTYSFTVTGRYRG